MADQEDLRVADLQRVVHAQVVVLLGGVRLLAVAQLGHEVAGLAPGPALGEPLDLEVLDLEGERLHLVGGERRAGHEVVVLGEVVGEAVADQHDHATLVAEQAAHREAHQHHDDREVEDEVADLAQVAALAGDRRGARPVGLRRPQPVATAAQLGAGLLEDLLDPLLALVRRVVGQATQVARRGGRDGADVARVDEGARDDASDQADHQQHVDGREPDRAVDVEEVEPLVDRRQPRVVVAPARRGERVDALLGHHRAGHRGQGEQQQQDQRGAHRGQLAPGPAAQLARGQLAGASTVGAGVAVGACPGAGIEVGAGHIATSKSETSSPCSQVTA